MSEKKLKLGLFQPWIAYKKLTTTGRMAAALQSRAEKYIKRIEKLKERMEVIQTRMEKMMERENKKQDVFERKWSALLKSYVEDMSEYQEITKQAEQTVEAQRAELEVLNSIVVPLLSTEHKVKHEEMNTKIAQAVQRRVLTTSSEGRSVE